MVMRELSHRTKNLLAVIVAMVRQTARTSTDVTVLQSQLIQRLQSLSASHDLLVAEDWTGASLEELVRAVLQPFIGISSDALECRGQPVFVNATAAQNLGLALHELATNAAKYGALSTSAGRVRVTWGFEADDTGTLRLVLRWEERGGPKVEPPSIKGLATSSSSVSWDRRWRQGRVPVCAQGVKWSHRHAAGIRRALALGARRGPAAPADAQATTVPPFGCNICPLIYDASSLARNTKHGATSFGCPARFIGALLPCLAVFSASNEAGIRGVQIGPGATALTRMPFSTSSWDSERVKATMAPLVAL